MLNRHQCQHSEVTNRLSTGTAPLSQWEQQRYCQELVQRACRFGKHTENVHDHFPTLIITSTNLCKGTYTKDRGNAEITISALHCASYREESKKQRDLLPAQSHSTLLKTEESARWTTTTRMVLQV